MLNLVESAVHKTLRTRTLRIKNKKQIQTMNKNIFQPVGFFRGVHFKIFKKSMFHIQELSFKQSLIDCSYCKFGVHVATAM